MTSSLRWRDLSIRYKILLPFLLGVFFFSGVFIWHSQRSSEMLISYTGQEGVKDALTNTQKILNQTLATETMLASSVAALDGVKEALGLTNRDQLLQIALPIVKQAKKSSGLDFFLHFHTPDGHSFLRTWKPESYGDDLKGFRQMVVDVIRTKKLVTGIEAGRGGLAIRAVAPVFWDGEYVGSVEVSIPLKVVLDLAKGTGQEIGVFITPETASVITKASFDSKVGNLFLAATTSPSLASVVTGPFLGKTLKEETITREEHLGLGGFPLVGYGGKVLGSLVVSRDLTALATLSRDCTLRSFLVAAISFLITTAFAIGVSWQLSRHLRGVVDRMNDIAQGEGDLTKELPVTGKDEMGRLALAFNLFLDKLRGLIGRVKDQTEVLEGAAGDLERTSGNLSQGCQLVHGRTNNIAEVSQTVAKRADEVHGMIAEMEKAITEISTQTASAAQVAQGAQEKIENVSQIISELDQSSQEIGEVLNFITSIAEQTNLLALNATIEAARAGEAGKGFAVVAGEVKELAKQTGQATESIGQKIQAIQEATSKVIQSTREVAEIISQINDISGTIAAAVEEQTATVSAIGESATEMSQQGETLSRLIPEMREASQLAKESMALIREHSQKLAELSLQMKGIVSQFKT
ncbi:methyl-accepting chemotaxis protein [Thermosulfuriphilus sp.]